MIGPAPWQPSVGGIMAKLSDCATIFQLAFGVNAILPSLLIAYGRTKESIAKRAASAIRDHDPTFVLSEKELYEWTDFIQKSYLILKVSNSFKWIVLGTSACFVLLSFYGLVAAAIGPDDKLADSKLFWFAFLSLLISPLFAFGYESWLRLVEYWIATRSDHAPQKLKMAADSFRLIQNIGQTLAEAQQMIMDVKLSRKRNQIRRAWSSTKVKLALARLEIQLRWDSAVLRGRRLLRMKPPSFPNRDL